MITVAEGIEKEKVSTITGINCGDSFIILIPGWNGVYLKCDNDTFVNISTGATYYVYDYEILSVRKLDFTLVMLKS